MTKLTEGHMNTSEFANVVSSLGLSATLVDQAIRTIPSRQWLERPARSSNHALWLIGHLAATRRRVMRALDQQGAAQPDPLFSGGAPLPDDARFPLPAEVAEAWRQVAEQLSTVVQQIPPSTLTHPIPPGARSFDGTIGGMLAGAAFHEAYHVGQLGYLTRWLGHPSLLEALKDQHEER
jgi:uncharacterized damage-inducible protein DinB